MNCQHEWELTFRDGPTDTNDWKCKKGCGETRTTRGHFCDPPKEEDEPQDPRSRL